MKKIFLTFAVSFMLFSQVFASKEGEQNAAEFLAEKGVITYSDDYYLDKNITRREMLKVMMNLSGNIISQTCEGKFSDINNDWGCKYAEAALKEGFISENDEFRPNDYVTEVEALKMIMQAKDIPVNESESYENWWDKYVDAANYFGMLSSEDSVSVSYSNREKVFYMSARTFPDVANNTVVKGVYEHCYPAGGPTPCLKINTENYPLVHTNGEYILLNDWIFTEPGTQVTMIIKSQKRLCDAIDSVGCNLWYSVVSLTEGGAIRFDHYLGKYNVPDVIFDSCGTVEKYKGEEWYMTLTEKIKKELSMSIEMCYSEALGLLVLGDNGNQSNEYYPRFMRLWVNTDTDFEYFTSRGGESGYIILTGLFAGFGKRDGTLISVDITQQDGSITTVNLDFINGNFSLNK